MLSDTQELEQNKNGFYQFKNIPTSEELAEFYSQHYNPYNYDPTLRDEIYNSDVIQHKVLTLRLVAKHAMNLSPKAKTVFDVGCGEGFLLDELQKLGIKDFKGADYNNTGVSFFFPQNADKFIQGNLYELAKEDFQKNKYDIITNTNVIEHVSDPEKLVKVLVSGMHKDSLLVVRCPNDFSVLHKKLVEENMVNEKWWIKYPDHLSYFNNESMTNLLESCGVEVVSKLSDYPIDLFLLNEHLNYVNDTSKGPATYQQRLKTDFFLATLDIDKVINLYKAYADLGLGRNMAYFCKLKK